VGGNRENVYKIPKFKTPREPQNFNPTVGEIPQYV